MPDFLDFFPLIQRSEADIRADWNVRANAGMTPDDPDWVDTREGAPFWLATQPQVVEHAMAYDRINEAAARAILSTSWGDALDAHAESYGEERGAATKSTGEITFTGTNGTIIGTGVRVGPVQTDPEITPPIFQTTSSGTITGGVLTLTIEALDAGSAGNVPAHSITFPHTGVTGVTSVDNAQATGFGQDAETDEALKKRLATILGGNNNANVARYAREALEWPGVGSVRVEAAWAGPGTVRIILDSDEEGNVVPSIVADALQAYMDPVPGMGKGWAPINHIVTVVSGTQTLINTKATVTFKPGYSLDGGGGAVAQRGALTAVITDYYRALESGDDVIFNAVEARFFRVEGVLNVSNLKIGTALPPTGTGDIAIPATQIARAGNVDLA